MVPDRVIQPLPDQVIEPLPDQVIWPLPVIQEGDTNITWSGNQTGTWSGNQELLTIFDVSYLILATLETVPDQVLIWELPDHWYFEESKDNNYNP